MPVVSYLMLSAFDQPFYPAERRCPVCDGDFSRGVAYLSAGALHLTADGQDSLQSDHLRAFLHVGFHGRETDMRDSSDISVVEDLHGGQFDLQWCSVDCMRSWLLNLIHEVDSLSGGPSTPTGRGRSVSEGQGE